MTSNHERIVWRRGCFISFTDHMELHSFPLDKVISRLTSLTIIPRVFSVNQECLLKFKDEAWRFFFSDSLEMIYWLSAPSSLIMLRTPHSDVAFNSSEGQMGRKAVSHFFFSVVLIIVLSRFDIVSSSQTTWVRAKFYFALKIRPALDYVLINEQISEASSLMIGCRVATMKTRNNF